MNDQEDIIESSLYNHHSTNAKKKKIFYLIILIFINLLNYVDRYTVAGTLIDIQHFFNINDAAAGSIVVCFYILFCFLNYI